MTYPNPTLDKDCTCDPAVCEADESGEHCQERGCGPCLHGPTEDPND